MGNIENALSGVGKNLTVDLNAAIEAIGCVYEKEGVVLPSKTGQFVYQAGKDEQLEVWTQMAALGQCFTSLCYTLLSDSPDVRKWLGVTAQEADFAQQTKSEGQPMVTYFGIDRCGPEWKINDFNLDRATITGFQPEFIEVFGKFFPWLVPRFVSFYDGLIKQFQNLSGKDNPRVFVLHNEVEAYRRPFANFASTFGFSIGSIQDFHPGKYDLVFRAMKSEVILREPEKYKCLTGSLQAGLPMVNPLGSYLAGNKGWEVVLNMQEVKLSSGIDLNWFPAPVVLIDGRVAISVGAGQEEKIEEWNESVRHGLKKDKNNLVLKRSFSFGGNQVYIGKKTKQWEWSDLINSIASSHASWVVETVQPKNEIDVLVEGSDGGKRLNMIQRWYGCGDFGQRQFRLTGEVFGGESLKVNASGYTFPVSFDEEGSVGS